MLELIPMTAEELTGFYPVMEANFPPNELKPLKRLLELYEQGFYDLWKLTERGKTVGCALMLRVKGGSFALLDYLVMARKNSGLGSRCLKLLQERYPEGIMAEVEAELDGLGESENAMRRRRQQFYRRAGFVPCPFDCRIFGAVYLVHLWAKTLPEDGCDRCRRELYHNYKQQLEPKWWKNNIFIEGFSAEQEDNQMNILVGIPMDDSQRAELARIAPGAQVVYTESSKATQEQVARAEIIFGNVDMALLKNAPKLKWLQLEYAGSDNYAVPGVLPEGVILTNSSGAYGLAISECMLAGIFHHIKRLDAYRENQKNHIWRNEGRVASIYGSTTLVVGFGDIGSTFARKMDALGSTVIGIRRNVTEKPEYISELYQMDALNDLLPRADFVSLSLPNSAATRNVMGAEQFKRMKSTALLVNVGRGTAVDTDALNDALRSGEIGGAVIDVVNPEPLPADHPLWDAPNLLLTPHVTGNYNLPETLRRVVNIALSNLEAYCSGGSLNNVVDFQTGYRKLK